MRASWMLFLSLSVASGQVPAEMGKRGLDAQCHPSFTVWLDAPTSGYGDGLCLQHALIFDGVTYYSRVAVPQLASALTPVEHRRHLWSRPQGGRIRFLDGEATAPDGKWVLEKSPAGSLIVRHEGSSRSYEYIDGRLAVASVGGRSFRFFRMGEITRVMDEDAGAGGIVLEAVANGATVLLAHGGRRHRLLMQGAQGVTRCEEMAAGGRTLKFEYERGLLVRVQAPDRTLQYRWGAPRWDNYFVPVRPLAPVVVSDGEWQYQVRYDGPRTSVTYRGKSGEPHGSWRVTPASDDH